VLAGRVVAGPHVRNACRRHLLDLVEGHKRGLTFDLKAAMRAINFFPDVLRLAGGDFEGKPFHLEPSQQFKTGSIFGWKRADGYRRFRKAYIEEGKGNGKSPWAAGVGMYMLMADGEKRAEVYAAASKRDQAMVLFRDAVAMREQSKALRDRLLPSGKRPVWQLTNLRTSSFFKPLATEDGSRGKGKQSGPRPSCGLLDEIHEMGDRVMIEMIWKGFKWRKQPLMVMTTNSGHDLKSVCWEQHDHAVKVAAGTMTPDEDFTFVGEPIDDLLFAYVCALDRDDDPLEDPSCHPKANPLIDVTITREKLEEETRQAKLLPGSRNETLRLNFCVWTDSETAWMARPTLESVLADFDPMVEHAGKGCSAGVDLSAVQDMLGLGFVVETGTKRITQPDGTVQDLPTYDAWIEGFTPANTLKERAARDKAPYEAWVQAGHLHATPGPLIRQDMVAAHLAKVNGDITIEQLAYDQYSYRQFRERLDEAGLTIKHLWHPQGGQRKAPAPQEEAEEAKKRGLKPGDPEWPEGLWMPGSLLKLEELILEGRIRIRRNPVFLSAAMSAVVQSDVLMGNRWLSKGKATNRIDVLVALLMAIGAATRRGLALQGRSVYEDEEIFM
jgi:phage terminase large subunit-like protein